MAELIKLLATYGAALLLEQSQNLIALLDRSGSLLAWNHSLVQLCKAHKEPAHLRQLLVFSSQPRLQTMLHDALQDQAITHGQLSFVLSETDLPASYNCWFLPLPNQQLLLYAELIPPLDHKSAQEYFRINNELAAKTRELQKARHALVQKQTALEEALSKVEQISRTDELTGLPNRRRALAFLEETIRRGGPTQPVVSVFLLDIDHFKQINDQFGHLAGDTVLRQIAGILAGSMRKVDCIGRYGGEEFLAVLPSTDLANAIAVAERVRQEIEATPFVIDPDQPLRITVSIGVARFHPPEDITRSLLVRADHALYQAKERGRNRVCSAEESGDEGQQMRENGSNDGVIRSEG